MQSRVLFSILRVVGHVVVLAMLASIIYACFMGVRSWAGIGV